MRPQGAVTSSQPVRANWQRPARKGLSPVASPTASKGSDAGRKGGHPLAGRLPTARGHRHRQCMGGDDDAVKAKRARTSF
ncbi:hypothetical protein B296_00056806 [Ensete ventricosum]|uniref:Uncharacterized protein n=1 Tax=Ensete ventricosum TaxID=4639 RepID=A0A426WWQ9_ENSVE|nr:hypothetical protein B296_00056806 [Ensete ventricosum]